MCGSWCAQVRLLLWKNCLLKRRSWFGSCVELLLPVGIMVLLCVVRNALDVTNVPDEIFVADRLNPDYSPGNNNPTYLTGVDSLVNSYRPQNGNNGGSDIDTKPRIAIAPATDPAVVSFASSLNASVIVDWVCTACQAYSQCPSVNVNPCAVYNCTDFYNANRAIVETTSQCRNVDLTGHKYNQQFYSPPCQPNQCTGPNCYVPDCSQSYNQAPQSPSEIYLFNNEAEMEAYVDSENYATTAPVIAVGVIFESVGGAAIGANNKWRYTMRGNSSLIPSTTADTDEFELVDPRQNYRLYSTNGISWLQKFVDTWIVNRARVAAGASLLPFQWVSVGYKMPIPAHRTDAFATSLIQVIPIFYLLAFIYPTARVVRAIVEEKEGRIREGMRMMGMADSAYVASWYISYMITFAISSFLVVLVGKGSNTIFKFSDFGFLFLWFFSFCVAMIAYGAAMSTLFSKAKMAGTMSYLFIFGGYVPVFVMNTDTFSESAKMGACLLPPAAFGLGAIQLTVFEGYELGISSTTAGRANLNFTFNDSLYMLWIDIILYSVLAWYLDKVVPSDYGTRLAPWFFLTPSYWAPTCACCASKEFSSGDLDANGRHNDPIYFEKVGENVKALGAGVEINGLKKIYDDGNVAVNGVSVSMYNGQLFCLLGHNGAGKSTLISALTGMTPINGGDATIGGLSIANQMGTVRQKIGVCPQHDVLYPNLTVAEHLRLFATLKGVPADAIEPEIAQLIADIGLTEKVNAEAGSLSGGQKRKLSVAIAFVGQSKVVFLDEPSSGMDPYSRRSLWEMLVKMKTGKVIVLTTHFMDEADILGDRIAIMTHGQIQCCGSSLFLKELYGVGYSMTITRTQDFEEQLARKKAARAQQTDIVVHAAAGGIAPDQKHDEKAMSDDPLVNLIKERLGSGAEQTSLVGAELGYRVPLTASKQFPALFQEMDTKKAYYQIRDYGVSVTTLEEVFLKVGGADAKQRSGAMFRQTSVGGGLGGSNNAVALKAELELNRTECEVCCRHFWALFVKRWHYAKRDFKSVVFSLLIPIVFLIIGFAILSVTSSFSFAAKTLGPQNYNQPLRVPMNNAQLVATPTATGFFDKLSAVPFAVADKFELEQYSSVGPYQMSVQLIHDIPGFKQSRYLSFYFPTDNEINATCQTVATTNSNGNSCGGGGGNGGCPQSCDWCQGGAFSFNQQIIDTNLQGPPTCPCQYMNNGQCCNKYCNVTTPGAFWNGGRLIAGYFWNNTAYHIHPIANNLISAGLLRNVSGDPNADITMTVHPFDYTLRQKLLKTSTDGFSAAIITVIAFIFIPASYAVFVVREREIKAKHLQSISGVSPIAYWGGAYFWDMVNYSVVFVASVVIVKIFDNASFVGENFAPVCVAFALYGPAVAPFSYMASFAFKSHSTAQTVLILVYFLTGLLLMIVGFALSVLPSTMSIAKTLKYIFRLFPTYCLGDTMLELAARPLFSLITGETLGPWAEQVSLYNVIFLGAEAVGYFIITILLEYITNSPACMCGDRFVAGGAYTAAARAEDEKAEDEDVTRERHRIMAEVAAAPPGGAQQAGKDAISLVGLRKVYDGPKVAVRNLYYGVGQGECFGFLGINGAGKTTTLSMLSGEFPPTAGSARLLGQDIVSQQDKCRRLLGYCPQFDAILDLLTAREHLFMFARFKGVTEAKIPGMVSAMIERLSLGEYADRPSGTYSGGNKRKLSVAIALIGDPPIVFLDEPSTGMDPVSRRFMWDFISTTMKGRSVILTTHSMEECEALCHRLGIMVGGMLRCLGTPQHIKSRFAQGFQLDLHTGDAPEIDQAIRQFMQSNFPNCVLAEFHPTRYKYQLPADLSLAQIFGSIETNREKYHIKEYSVGQTTLEQVFIEFAKQQSEEKGPIKALLTANLSAKGAGSPSQMPFTNANIAAQQQRNGHGSIPPPPSTGIELQPVQNDEAARLKAENEALRAQLARASVAGGAGGAPPPPPGSIYGEQQPPLPPAMDPGAVLAQQQALAQQQQLALMQSHAYQQQVLTQQAAQQNALLQAQYYQAAAAAAGQPQVQQPIPMAYQHQPQPSTIVPASNPNYMYDPSKPFTPSGVEVQVPQHPNVVEQPMDVSQPYASVPGVGSLPGMAQPSSPAQDHSDPHAAAAAQPYGAAPIARQSFTLNLHDNPSPSAAAPPPPAPEGGQMSLPDPNAALYGAPPPPAP